MRGIFISYRREDAEGQAGRLFDDLAAHFGADAVFMDVADIKKGLDFRRIIDEHVASSGVVLVLIGKRWLSATDSTGKRRLDDPNDFVRFEAAAALSRDIPVVPVLVQDAAMPTEHELPDALKALAFRNGTELTHARWDSDVKLLIEDLKPYLQLPAPAARAPESVAARSTPPARQRSIRRSLWIAAAIAVISSAVSIYGYRVWDDPPMAQHRNAAGGKVAPATAAQRQADSKAAPPLTSAKPALKTADQPGPRDRVVQSQPSRAAPAKSTADADAKRRALARQEAEERRQREEAERLARLAEEQRKRDEEARLARAQAERERIAAEQAAAIKVLTDITSAVIGGR